MENTGGQSKLDKAGAAARDNLIPLNTYNGNDQTNEYSTSHTRALADDITPKAGRGTGNYLDIDNYNAGTSVDINGDPNIAAGGGRKNALANNLATWGYGPKKPYQKPDISKNKGQVII